MHEIKDGMYSPENEKGTFLSHVLKEFKESLEADDHNRKAFVEDMKFYNNEQWDHKTKAERDADGRPSLTLNQLPLFVKQIIGDIRLNRPRIKVRPAGGTASTDIGRIYDGIIQNIQNTSKFDQICDSSAEQTTVGGLGAWRIITEYSDNGSFNQRIGIRWIPNPLSVYFDPAPYDLDKEFAKYCFVTTYISRSEFSKKYKNISPTSIPEVGTGDQEGWFEKDKVKIAEYWCRKEESKTIVQLSTGEVLDKSEAEQVIEDALAARNSLVLQSQIANQQIELPELPRIVKSRSIPIFKVYRYVICGCAVLEGPEEFPSSIIPIVPVYGETVVIEGKRYIRGMVRFAKDACRMYNYWRSAETETIALQPKSPWVATPAQIEGFESDYRNANRKNIAVLRYNPDNQSPPPQRQAPPQTSPGMFQGSQSALTDLKSTIGMFGPSLGMEGSERTAPAILARERSGDVGNFVFMDNLCRALRLTGKILIDMIPNVYDTEDVIKYVNPLGKDEEVIINKLGLDANGNHIIINQLKGGRYDVVVDTGPNYTTARIEALEGMFKFGQYYPQAAPIIADLVARMQDWPYSEEIADRLEKMLPDGIRPKQENEPPPQIPPQVLYQQAKLEKEQTRAMVEKIRLMQEVVKLQKDESGADIKKTVLNILSELFSSTHEGDKNILQ